MAEERKQGEVCIHSLAHGRGEEEMATKRRKELQAPPEIKGVLGGM